MFEDRLAVVRKQSETLGSCLGTRIVTLSDLRKVCEEFCLVYNYDFVLCTLDGTKIDRRQIRGFSYSTLDHKYVVAVNLSFINEGASWYFAAHECSHILLHQLYLVESWKNFNQDVEEEANLFAQLCFWPLNSIFDSKSLKGYGPLTEAKVIEILSEFMSDYFKRFEFKYNEQKLRLYSYLFLRRMERFLPRNYEALMNRSYPIL